VEFYFGKVEAFPLQHLQRGRSGPAELAKVAGVTDGHLGEGSSPDGKRVRRVGQPGGVFLIAGKGAARRGQLGGEGL
jgi:hypothetical protein